MPTATTLGNPGKAVTFQYRGDVQKGVVIEYNYADVTVDQAFLSLILTTFGKKRILGGFSKTKPTPGGFGEWVNNNSKLRNSKQLTPQHASRIAAIFVAEGYATSVRDGNTVIIKFT